MHIDGKMEVFRTNNFIFSTGRRKRNVVIEILQKKQDVFQNEYWDEVLTSDSNGNLPIVESVLSLLEETDKEKAMEIRTQLDIYEF